MSEPWPDLTLSGWQETRDTLHRWTQVVGKVRLALEPMINHWWQVTLYVSARGLTTSIMPAGDRGLEIEFDFVDHVLDLRATDGQRRQVPLEPRSVASFYEATMAALVDIGVPVTINPRPQEVVEAGRLAPKHRGGVPNCPDWVQELAYSHEVSSCGYWPGGSGEGAFYAYAYPEPSGFAGWAVEPPGAYYDADLGEFLLPYTAVRTASDPDQTLQSFFQSTYDTAAELSGWDRAALEARPEAVRGR